MTEQSILRELTVQAFELWAPKVTSATNLLSHPPCTLSILHWLSTSFSQKPEAMTAGTALGNDLTSQTDGKTEACESGAPTSGTQHPPSTEAG